VLTVILRAGLVPAAVVTHLLGKVGAFMLVLQLFMAVTASGAAEQMAVASLVAYDIYRTYFNPQVRYRLHAFTATPRSVRYRLHAFYCNPQVGAVQAASILLQPPGAVQAASMSRSSPQVWYA
jgi:hypothetical protein